MDIQSHDPWQVIPFDFDGRPCRKLVKDGFPGDVSNTVVVCLIHESCPWRLSEGHRKCLFPWEGVQHE